MNGPNGFTGDLLVKYLDGTNWEVAQGFTYHLGTPDGREFVSIGAGLVTDFASIPLVIRLVFRSPGGKWDKPAVVHDCLYRTARLSATDGSLRYIERDEADRIFLEAMSVTGVGWLARRVFYRGVRVGGMFAWDRHRKAEDADTTA